MAHQNPLLQMVRLERQAQAKDRGPGTIQMWRAILTQAWPTFLQETKQMMKALEDNKQQSHHAHQPAHHPATMVISSLVTSLSHLDQLPLKKRTGQ